jgi:hypothetical protein
MNADTDTIGAARLPAVRRMGTLLAPRKEAP